MGIFSDIVALAKAGYTPAQVKELMEIDNAPRSEEAAEITAKEPEQPEQPKEPETDEKETNASSQIAEMQKQIESLKEQLKTAQKNNTKKDLAGSKPEKTLDDIVRSFM